MRLKYISKEKEYNDSEEDTLLLVWRESFERRGEAVYRLMEEVLSGLRIYDGNGRTDRFITSYFLKKNFHLLLGLRLSVYIKRNRKAYYKLLEEADSEINRGDLTPFLQGFLKILLGTIEDTIGVLERKKDQLQRYEKKIDALGFHDKLMEEIYYILLQAAFFYGRGVTIIELADMVGKARNTIQKRLDSMPVNHLIIEKKGKTNFYKLDLLMFKESGSRRSV